MEVPFFAIIVGVSKYRSYLFDPLPAAKADALHLARSLVRWGIPESHIELLCNDFEKKETFDLCLQKIKALLGSFQLLFYFCGHGYRTKGSHPESYLIFSDTEIDGDCCKSGINLEYLLQEFTHMNTSSIYLFIDACHLRFNSIVNPKLIEEIRGKSDSKKSLFCLLSSGIFQSYESLSKKYGYFTEALIKSLSYVRQSDLSPDTLVQSVQEKLQ